MRSTPIKCQSRRDIKVVYSPAPPAAVMKIWKEECNSGRSLIVVKLWGYPVDIDTLASRKVGCHLAIASWAPWENRTKWMKKKWKHSQFCTYYTIDLLASYIVSNVLIDPVLSIELELNVNKFAIINVPVMQPRVELMSACCSQGLFLPMESERVDRFLEDSSESSRTGSRIVI